GHQDRRRGAAHGDPDRRHRRRLAPAQPRGNPGAYRVRDRGCARRGGRRVSDPERPVLDPRLGAASGNGQPSGVAEPLEPPHPTDLGNAERFLRDHRANVRFSYAWGAWFLWDSIRFRRDEDGTVERLAAATIRAILAEAA